ncbi:hypothetical protein Lal_00021654 [Lupinus albus]|nr:hypothetical protein Lal_00021654 [Lupinus albus]
MSDTSQTSFFPGFRFHPTDEELVRFYLKRKLTGKYFRFDPIAEVDVYKNEPWDLPPMSKLKTRDLEWYFYSALDKKYGNGSRTKRITEKGYWKTTGKDRTVKHGSRTVGMKKTLVYHAGRAPHGDRTNWVMHEYKLVDEQLAQTGILLDALVLCRIFEKSGAGPKNGEKYGAPLIEEEWEDDEVAPMPVACVEVSNKALAVEPIDFLETSDLEKIYVYILVIAIHGYPFVVWQFPSHVVSTSHMLALALSCFVVLFHLKCPALFTSLILINAFNYQKVDVVEAFGNTGPPSSFYHGECSSYPEDIQGPITDQKPLEGRNVGVSEPQSGQPFSTAEEYAVDINSMNDGDSAEQSSTENALGFTFTFDDLDVYLDATDYPPVKDTGLFLETNDLVNPFEGNPTEADPSATAMLDEYLSYSDDDISKYLSFDSPISMESENLVPDQKPHIQQNLEGDTNGIAMDSKHDIKPPSSNEPTSKQNTQPLSGSTHPFVKQVNKLLAGIQAPPAFASEFPSKDIALGLHPAAQSSNSAHVTTGMISITDITSGGNVMDQIARKNGRCNAILSTEFSQSDVYSVALMPVLDVLSSKTAFVLSHDWIFFMIMLFPLLVLSLVCKFGSFTSAAGK